MTAVSLHKPAAGRAVAALLLVLLLWPAAARASSPGAFPAVTGALKTLDATRLDEDWYFAMDLVEDGEHRVIESDPTREPYARRQLVSVNGEAPDATQRAKFDKAEKKRVDDLDPDREGYTYLVDVSSLVKEGRRGEHTAFSFAPRVKDMEKAREQLRGTLLLNNATGQIDRLEIRNMEPLAPAFSVSVDTYRLVFTFFAEQGEQLLQTLESHAVGRAGFLKRFDSRVTIEFRDYRRAP